MNESLLKLTLVSRIRVAALMIGCASCVVWIIVAFLIDPKLTCIGSPLENAEVIEGEVP